MATIKDVAKLSGVSLGSVSNVLNGKTNNPTLIRQVEEAMAALHYCPDAAARSLKNTRTFTIGLILPGALQQYSKFAMLLEQSLREKGYTLIIKFSRNNQLLERRAVESFQEQRVDCIVLWSLLTNKANKRLKNIKVPVVLIGRNEHSDFSGNQLVMSYTNAFVQLIKSLQEKNLQRVYLVMERDLLEVCQFQQIFMEYFPQNGQVRVVDGTQERGFEAAMELNGVCGRPDAVIADSFETGLGISRAMDVLAPSNKPLLYTFKEYSWLQDEKVFDGVVDLSVAKLTEKVMRLLEETIQGLHESEGRVSVATAVYHPIVREEGLAARTCKGLRLAMYNCSSSRSLRMLSTLYEQETGCRVQLDMYTYSELEKLLHEPESRRKYDGFMLDVPWLEDLAESGALKNLDDRKQAEPEYFRGFVDGALEAYSLYKGSVYALPFMSGVQLLFYQRDLFENKTMQIKYQRQYGEELQPPATWSEFNHVAEFFTKQLNPASPVEFGLSMSGGCNIYTTVDFLCRFWSYGGRVFDDLGRVTINSASAVSALNNLRQSHQYCSDVPLQSWDECAQEFSRGKCAMVILYNSDVGNISNYTTSKVAGNIGYSLVPGKASVMGGWSLAVNPDSACQQETEQFLHWACSGGNSVPMMLLGGSTLRKEFYECADLDQIMPWKRLIAEGGSSSRKRTIPRIEGGQWGHKIYTTIIPQEIVRFLQENCSPQEALTRMEQEILKLHPRVDNG